MIVTQEVMDAMKRTNDIFDSKVVGGKDIESLDLVYTSEARILPPGASMMEGRAAIKAFWKGAIHSLGLRSARLETVSAETCGEQVLEVGRAHLSTTGNATVIAKYVVYWKQEGGDWKWDVDIWNLDN